MGHYGDAVYPQLLSFSQICLLNWVEGLCVSTVELKASPKDRDSMCVTVDKISPSAFYFLLWCKREEGIWLCFRGWIFWAGSKVKHISACKLSTLGKEAEKDNKHGTPQCYFYSLFFREKLYFKMCATASRSLQNIDSGGVCVFSLFLRRENCCPEIVTMWKNHSWSSTRLKREVTSKLHTRKGERSSSVWSALGEERFDSLLELCSICFLTFVSI